MPANPITALTNRRVLNKIVNQRIKPYTALTTILFPPARKENLVEEFAQVDVLEGTYGMAPFVKVGQKAIIMDFLQGTSYTIETPFINIKRPLQYSTKLAKRLVGMNVFSNTEQTRALIRRAIEQDVDFMNTLIDDRIEWMIAFLLRGQIDYSVEGQDSFTISTGKPAANTFTVSVLWSNDSAVPLQDIFDAKLVVNKRRGPTPNIAICGATAGGALRDLIETGKITSIKTTSGINAGEAELLSRFRENGMVRIGLIGDIEFWQYTGEFNPDDGGSAEPFIRDDYVEFISTSNRAAEMRSLMFGMIPDLRAIMEGQHITERYLASKPPEIDQGTYEGIIKTRPFPWLYRPDWNVSMKVT